MTASPSPVIQDVGPVAAPQIPTIHRPTYRTVETASPHSDAAIEPARANDAATDWRWGMSGFG